MQRPDRAPIGLQLAQVAKVVSRAFDDTLAAAGGSLPVWLILISLKSRQLANQRQLAAAVGIQGATLTHHLNAMESAGIVTRRRDPDNRRVHLVEITPAGDALFLRLRDSAIAFDKQLRTGLSERQIGQLDTLLGRLRDNTSPTQKSDEELNRR
ncbi:MAG: MarR family winged helix-turn-helix transcriptional regulator [Actinomycetota bacterium]|nr:MarR family winged helix-turn-helix transcriptional regulator [Actinomycetota bacterium]